MNLYEQTIESCRALPPDKKLNRAREFVHIAALDAFGRAGAWDQMSFVGGTALRCAHGLPRYSEDLDFSANTTGPVPFDQWMNAAGEHLRKEGFEVMIKMQTPKEALFRGEIRIAKLRHDLGEAPMKAQVFTIKAEVDCRPPSDAEHAMRTTNLEGLPPIEVRMHDLPSLMAGKVHALWCRPFLKGRDWFDLAWYRRLDPATEPNLAQLQNALEQTRLVDGVERLASNWKEAVTGKLGTLDWEALFADVAPFIPGEELDFTRESLRELTLNPPPRQRFGI